MQFRVFRDGDIGELTDIWNDAAVNEGYKPFENVNEFSASVIENPNFCRDGCILAFDDRGKSVGFVNAVCKKEFLTGETAYNTPGYINMLMVREGYRNQGIGSELLARGEKFLISQMKKTVAVSHKCPIKLTWYVNDAHHEHNKAPGIKVNSLGYYFLLGKAYTTKQYDVSYYLKLKDFEIPTDIKLQIERLNSEGVSITYYNMDKHFGYKEMFNRLSDESFLKKFEDGIAADMNILVAADGDGRICGSAGTIFKEKGGRGFFSALAVDPLYSGRNIGNMIFFQLCSELKKIGAEYMTLFVTKDNFAKKIYEKAGFTVVQEWAILEKEL